MPCQDVMIRRSDDSLVYNCTTTDGMKVIGEVKSEIEGAKMAASVLFWDLGITDAITDKHRTYQRSTIIPVSNKSELISDDQPEKTVEEAQK